MTTANQSPKRAEIDDGAGFDVTVLRTIGRVVFDSLHGTLGPFQAAMEIIARDGDEGRYRFPGADENTEVHVDISIVKTDAA